MATEKKISVASWCLPKKVNFGPCFTCFRLPQGVAVTRGIVACVGTALEQIRHALCNCVICFILQGLGESNEQLYQQSATILYSVVSLTFYAEGQQVFTGKQNYLN